jgi:PhzF family phenazine biosynthesis protein
MELAFFHVDAFADEAFKGNPAAVFILETWLSDELMQSIAAEFNLSETVFSVWEDDILHIRWFTPEAEVALCGHATLATAHVLQAHLGYAKSTINFSCMSGPLVSRYENGLHTLDFPANKPLAVGAPDDLESILGCSVDETLSAAQKLLVIVENEATLANLQPDFSRLAKLPYRGVCVSSPASGSEQDFVCRYFAPAIGINEDPVTGSAYTLLVPYYAQRFGKQTFKARQLSKRGGDLSLEIKGERVLISGKAHTVMQGTISLDFLYK